MPTMRPVESNPTRTLTMELTGPPRKADRGVRGTLAKFKRRRGVAKSANVPRFKSVKISRFPHPHPKFHHRDVLGLAEAQEQRGRARVMFLDGIQILVERRFLNTLDRKSAPIRLAPWRTGKARTHSVSPYCLPAPRPGPAAAGAAGAANSAATGKLPSYGGQFGAGRSLDG